MKYVLSDPFYGANVPSATKVYFEFSKRTHGKKNFTTEPFLHPVENGISRFFVNLRVKLRPGPKLFRLRCKPA